MNRLLAQGLFASKVAASRRFALTIAILAGCMSPPTIAQCPSEGWSDCVVRSDASSGSAAQRVALVDRREPVSADDRHRGIEAVLRGTLRSARASVVFLSEVRSPRYEPLSPGVGTGFLAATQCHVITAAHVVAPTRTGDEPLIARLDRKTSPVGARVRVQADFVSHRAQIEREGTVVAAGNLHRSMAEDWALLRLDRDIPSTPFALPAFAHTAGGHGERQQFMVAAYHGDLTHMRGRVELYGEVCERAADRGPFMPGRVFRSYCTASPGASGGPELTLIDATTLRVTGIVLAADREGLDQFFGARGVPEKLWPGRIAGLRIETVLPELLAAIERTPCTPSR